MPFHFPLAPLLRLRKSVERQRAIHLKEASLRVSRVEETLERLRQFLADSATEDRSRLREGRAAVELHFATFSRENLVYLRTQLESAREKLELEQQQAANEYHRAFREREVLESLRETQHHTYQQDELRNQQRDLDESHLIQHWRRRDG